VTEEFFKVCDANGITLNTKKIQWDHPEALFAGFVVNGEGYKIDPVLTKALSEFLVPKNLKGLANQTCNFSDERSCLDKLRFQELPVPPENSPVVGPGLVLSFVRTEINYHTVLVQRFVPGSCIWTGCPGYRSGC